MGVLFLVNDITEHFDELSFIYLLSIQFNQSIFLAVSFIQAAVNRKSEFQSLKFKFHTERMKHSD